MPRTFTADPTEEIRMADTTKKTKITAKPRSATTKTTTKKANAAISSKPTREEIERLAKSYWRRAAAWMDTRSRTGCERKRNCSKQHRPKRPPNIRRSALNNSLADSAVSCRGDALCAKPSQLIQPPLSESNAIGLRASSRPFRRPF